MPAADTGRCSGPAAVSDSEADQLFECLQGYGHVALAVSGGSDSVALLWLAGRWAKRAPKVPRLSVLTVDHGLRAGSGEEAARVAAWASGLGVAHHILTWTGRKPQTAIQAEARAMRYKLMAEWCAGNDCQAVVTAHTADDQAETVLMRLGRGSGVDGLAGIMEINPDLGPAIRPFLQVTRDSLRATLKAAGQAWLEDPSNSDEAFERVRLRNRLRQACLDEDLAPQSLALSAKRVRRARDALWHYTDVALRQLVTTEPAGYFRVETDALADLPAEIRLRVLGRLIVLSGGSWDAGSLAGLERLDSWLLDGSGSARTLGGCRIVRRKREILAGREPGRISQPVMNVSGREGAVQEIWDRRFVIELQGLQSFSGLRILTLQEVADPGDAPDFRRPRELPAFVWNGLPVLVQGDVVIAVPALGQKCPGFPDGLRIRTSFPAAMPDLAKGPVDTEA